MNQNEIDRPSMQLKQNRTWCIRMSSDPERFQLLAICVIWIKKRRSERRKGTLLVEKS